MSARNTPSYRLWEIPAGYRFMRRLLKLAAWLFFPRIRFLNEDRLEPSGPALLAVNYPESLTAALLLVAALDRPVLCLLSSHNLRGAFQRFMGRRLGIIAIDPLESSQEPWSARLAGAVANWGTLALLAGNSGTAKKQGRQKAGSVSTLILESIQQSGGLLPLAVYPIHAFLPPDSRKSGLLVYVDAPIWNGGATPEPEKESPEAVLHLTLAARLALQKNVFALAPAEIDHFHHDLEDVAHEDLEEEWAKFAEWKQEAKDLHLSGIVKQWIHKQNQVNPGRLVALRTLLEEYRESRRRCSLGQLQVETSSLWRHSGLRVAAAWVESLLGLPIAFYGFLNHLPAGVVLFVAGLLKNSPRRDPKVEWLFRCSVVMGFYILQVWLFYLWQGRSAAGYYTLTLPLSGAYLWRYWWLIHHRTRLLLIKATLPARSRRLRQARKVLLGKLEGEMNLYVQSLGMPS